MTAQQSQGGPAQQDQTQETQQVSPEIQAPAQTYQLTSKDLVILAQPSVCSITSYYYGLVYDPNRSNYFGPYYSYLYYGTGFCVNPSTGHILTARM